RPPPTPPLFPYTTLFRSQPALAPVNIIVAEFGSNPSYWQPTMRSTFCGLLTNSTGTKLRTLKHAKHLLVVYLAQTFRSITEREAKIFKANNTKFRGSFGVGRVAQIIGGANAQNGRRQSCPVTNG